MSPFHRRRRINENGNDNTIIFRALFILLTVAGTASSDTTTDFDFGTLTLSNLNLLGDAHIVNDTIRLTRDLSVPTSGAGRALYSKPVRFLRSSSSSSSTPAIASFSTFFTFSVSNLNPSSIGGGLAFLLAHDPSSLGGSGGLLGLQQLKDDSAQGSGSGSFLAVEFDTLMDVEFRDINGNHVGLDLNGMVSAEVGDLGKVNVDLKSGDSINAWIDFDGRSRSFNVSVSYSNLKPKMPFLSSKLELERYVSGEFMYVGFSGSTQGSTETHTIEWWSFSSSFEDDDHESLNSTSPPPPPPNSPSPSLTGQAAHENATSRSPSPAFAPHSQPSLSSEEVFREKKRSSVWSFSTVATAGAFCLALLTGVGVLFICCVYYSSYKHQSKFSFPFSSPSCKLLLASEVIKMPKEFSYRELKSATKGFDSSRIIGNGAFGTVYRGTLPPPTLSSQKTKTIAKTGQSNSSSSSSSRVVAVKRCSHSTQGKNEFLSELSIIGTLRHRNLVPLQGYCHDKDKGEILLVYDLMPNGSLDKALFDESRPVLPWPHRKKILLGVSSALAYLHQECEARVIHRDVKTSNIMLDRDFNARLGDFGLARQVDHDKSPDATIAAGTMGYLAPEYLLTGRATEKSDVFSFGAVVLEVATGRRPIDHRGGGGRNLVDWVWGLYREGRVVEAADQRLMKGVEFEFDEEEMTRVLIVGLACSQPDPLARPTMRGVVQMLSGETQVPVVPRTKPTLSFTTSELLLTLQDTVSDCNPDFNNNNIISPSSSSSSLSSDHGNINNNNDILTGEHLV